MNLPPLVGIVMSAKPELVAGLATVLPLEALYDAVEVVMIDAHNRRVLTPKPPR